MKVPLFNMEGKQIGDIELPREVFDVPMNADLLHQAIRVGFARKRRRVAHTKTREEVRGGGRKPWRQKGTGRARHGSIRSPIWRGGGVVFGPRREKDPSRDFPRAMKQKALAVSLSQKVRDGEVAIIDALTLELPKTKIVAQAIGSIIKGAFGSDVKRPSVTLTTADRNPLLLRAARNLSSTNVRSARELNIFDVLSKRYLIVSKDAVPILVTRVSNRRRTKDDA